MRLRSGNLYDDPEARKAFDKLLFASIWEEARKAYLQAIGEDYFNHEKTQEALEAFQRKLTRMVTATK